MRGRTAERWEAEINDFYSDKINAHSQLGITHEYSTTSFQREMERQRKTCQLVEEVCKVYVLSRCYTVLVSQDIWRASPQVSQPDLFRLCAGLLPNPGVAHLTHYPQCMYTCVLCLSVASSSCLINPTTCFPIFLSFSSLCFLVSPGFTISACPDPEPACRSVPCDTALDYWPLPALTCCLPAPCFCNTLLLLRTASGSFPEVWQ